MLSPRPHKRSGWPRLVGVGLTLAQALIGVLGWLRWRWRRVRSARPPAHGKVVTFAQGGWRAVREVSSGRESWREFAHDVRELARDFFIPHHGNDHRPGALRPKSLAVYAVAALLVKAAVSGALFLYSPTPARLAQIVAREIVALTNRARVRAGLPALAVDPVLTASARAKADDMITRGYFAHDSPDGKKPWSWIDRGRYDYIYAGENLAIDFVAADAIHEAFMTSPSHRANILNNRYQDIGVAVISGEMGGRVTELLVQFFGTRRDAVTKTTALRGETNVLPTASPRSVPSVAPDATEPRPPAVSPPPGTAGSPAPTAAVVAGGARELRAPVAEPRAPAGSREIPRVIGGQTSEPSGFGGAPAEPILVVAAPSRLDPLVETALTFMNFFLSATAVFLILALVLNIFIRIRIQRPDLIFQSLAVISFVIALLMTKLHFLERLSHQLRILGGG